jgi:hypothetical protein
LETSALALEEGEIFLVEGLRPHTLPFSSSLTKDMLTLNQLILLVLEHKDEDITALGTYVHSLGPRKVWYLYATNQK